MSAETRRYGLPTFKRDDPISARKLNKIVDHLIRATIQPPSPGASTGINVAMDAAGTRIWADGSSVPWALCQLSGSLGPATGSWPSLTATTATVDLYAPSAGSLTKIESSATVYNWRNVTWAASKTTLVLLASDGTWCVDDQDC